MNSTQATGWWNRPCGGREVFRLALPLVISTASWSLTLFVDRMFLFWHSTSLMAAAMPAGMLHFTLLCLPLGVAAYVNTFVAQYVGSGRPERIGISVWQGVWVGLAVTPLFLLTIPLAPMVFAAAGHAAELAALETVYYQTLAYGAGDTRFVLCSNLIMAPVPILACWWGISYGGWGLIRCWVVITAWICALGLIYLARFLQGRWRTMRVVESDVPDADPAECVTDAAP